MKLVDKESVSKPNPMELECNSRQDGAVRPAKQGRRHFLAPRRPGRGGGFASIDTRILRGHNLRIFAFPGQPYMFTDAAHRGRLQRRPIEI
ncbi:hypothetical protein [Dactylosporangium fulvum]|uniref:Uncharacterized protein n=1 Tax=Dactylosporangium fulvum TaxID=53359 RepID=A0ABY5WBD5_9ACTN|nr:hypothetical protein [Dactylosporangium fulvum]UWP86586.1 hypothetical protein Dfulv_21035 [Dactylosporangium fulvum]